MSDLSGSVVLITGANTGIGRATAVSIALKGPKLYLAGRSEARHRDVLDEIRAAGHDDVHFLPLDLGSLASVRRCAEAFLEREEKLDVLLNNAGLAGHQGLTEDGFEITFGVNHLGPFLLTELLAGSLAAAGRSRVVNVSSKAHYKATGIDFDALRKPTATTTGLDEYQVSKLCNVLHAKELGRRRAADEIHTYSLHPGVIASDVWRKVPWPVRPLMTAFMKSNAEGAKTSIYCATSPEVADHTGRYYDECREKEPSDLAKDEALAEELWERSLEWTQP